MPGDQNEEFQNREVKRDSVPLLPKEIQDAFARIHPAETENFIQTVYPQDLLVVKEEKGTRPQTVLREYYAWIPGGFGKENFLDHTCATFINVDGLWVPKSLRLKGERTDENENRADIRKGYDYDYAYLEFYPKYYPPHANEALNTGVLAYNLRKPTGSFIWFVYSENSTVDYVIFSAARRHETYIASTTLYEESRFNQLFEKGRLNLEVGFHTLDAHTEDGQVIVNIQEKGKPVGRVTFPRAVYKEKIIDNLFRRKTLDDPQNSDPELDKSWRFPDLPTATGITWNDFGDSTQPQQSEPPHEDLAS